MALDRTIDRDLHLYDGTDRQTLLGGLVVTHGMTNANFYSMVGILLLTGAPGLLSIQDANFVVLERNDHALLPGDYYVAGNYQINNEPFLIRTFSVTTGSRLETFNHEVRLRDRACVISGRRATTTRSFSWTGFEAAHIFPLAYEGYLHEHHYGSCIDKPAPNGETINSVQNGLLLDTSIHKYFDMYLFSINPDDNYKIVWFVEDSFGFAGTFLKRQLLDHPDRPAGQLLKWDFRQAVLANMRGRGEPIFEHDFPPGSDIMGEILAGPKAGKRMEAELFGRLAVHAAPQEQGYGFLGNDG